MLWVLLEVLEVSYYYFFVKFDGCYINKFRYIMSY